MSMSVAAGAGCLTSVMGTVMVMMVTGTTANGMTPSSITSTSSSILKEGSAEYNETFIKNITSLLDNLLNNYDKKLRPAHMTGKPLVVTVDIDVRSIGPVSEVDMEFSMDCYFRQKWLDERLSFEGGKMKRLSLASKVLYDIWRPDTYIRNGRQSYLHKLTIPNMLLRVSHNGEVYVSQRLTIRARCPMHLRKFPMDTQACPLYIGSLGYSDRELQFRWANLIGTDKELNELAQYKLKSIKQSTVAKDDQRGGDEKMSVLQAYFVLERQQGYYALQIYTPCTLIVVMSWVSFWINKEASPARVQLGIMTVLNMCTVGLGHRTALPKVSYSTALDIYVVVCFGFVFSALIEYALINFAHLVHVQRKVCQIRGMQSAIAVERMRNFVGTITMGNANNNADEKKEMIEQQIEDHPTSWQQRLLCRSKNPRLRGLAGVAQKAERKRQQLLKTGAQDPKISVDTIDSISKFLFPFLYISFNAVYWSAFLRWIPDEIDSWVDLLEAGHGNTSQGQMFNQ